MIPHIPKKGFTKTVFMDASSAILLYKSDLFTPLLNRWQPVMAPAVFREITERGYPGAAYFKTLETKNQTRAARIILREPGPTDHPLFALKKFLAMDRGEKETLQIFCNSNRLEKTGAFVLVDDGRAARFCHARQIPFINALLVPKIFWYSGFMDQQDYLKKTARLCELGRYSKQIMERAEQFSRKELAYFIQGNSHEH